jgi:hypothetical protein
MTVKAKPIRYAGWEEKSTWRGGPRTPRKKLERADRFTAPVLREMMLDVVKPRLKMPTDDALEKLASILEWWRPEYWRHQHVDPLETKVAGAAADLLAGLEELRQIYAANGDGYLRKRIDTIDGAVKAINRLYSESIAVEHSGNLTWQKLANVLPADFAEAIRSTNPQYKIGIGHKGPLARFIAKIASRLTGENPTPGAAATELKDFRRRFLRGKDFGDRLPSP